MVVYPRPETQPPRPRARFPIAMDVSSALSTALEEIDPEALARDCLDFVAVRSETGDEGAGSAFFAGLLRREGWEVSLDDAAPGRPNVVCRLPGGPGAGPALVLNGHVDTIPIGVSWPPRREDGWVCGRGAEDMKGGLVAMVHAARAVQRALQRSATSLRRDVWLTAVVGHETPVGHKEGPLRLIERLRSGHIPAEAILVCEGPAAIWRASLGSAVFDLSLDSPRPPVHTVNVPYSENPVRAFSALFGALDALDARLAARPGHPLAGPDRINVGMVGAGDYPNRLPVRLRVTGTRRWGPGETAQSVRAELLTLAQDAVAASGLDLRPSIELTAVREPFEVPSDHPLVGALREGARRVLGQPPSEIGLPLVGDASLYVNDAAVPAVYYGPAYRTAHSDDERVAVSDLVRAARIYACTIINYANRQ
jgi:acetylornithine deacetylase/succinyl-diaminopimelate desuccinylase-like protein